MESTEHEHRPAEGTRTRRIAGGEALNAHALAQLEEIESLVNLGRWVWDVGSGVLTCSPQLIRIYGLASPDLMPTSESFLLRVHQADRTRVRASILRALSTGTACQFQHRVVRMDHEIRVLRTRGTLEHGEDGRPVRIHALNAVGAATLQVIGHLRPSVLEEHGLLAALRADALRVGRQAAIPVSVSGTEISPRLPPGVETALFRLAQEAIANAARHAGCTLIRISLTGTAAHARLEIQDNGSGFDVTTVAGSATGEARGITLMRERAEGVSAAFRLSSQPGSGARITVDYRG